MRVQKINQKQNNPMSFNAKIDFVDNYSLITSKHQTYLKWQAQKVGSPTDLISVRVTVGEEGKAAMEVASTIPELNNRFSFRMDNFSFDAASKLKELFGEVIRTKANGVKNRPAQALGIEKSALL